MSTATTGTESFKRCPLCGHPWPDREAVLGDPQVQLIGFQAFTDDPVQGMLLFNHLTCGTTMALRVTHFTDLYDGPIRQQSLAGTEACPRHCFSEDDLEPCPNACAGAWVREVLQRVRRWPKQPATDELPVSA